MILVMSVKKAARCGPSMGALPGSKLWKADPERCEEDVAECYAQPRDEHESVGAHGKEIKKNQN